MRQPEPALNLCLLVVLPLSSPRLFLPPGFSLHSVCKSVRSILKRPAADESTQTVRPIRVGQECPQHGTAEELAAGPDLRRNRELSQPAIELAGAAVRVIGAAFKSQRKILCKK